MAGSEAYAPCREVSAIGRLLPAVTCSGPPVADSRDGRELVRVLRVAARGGRGVDPEREHALGRAFLLFPGRLDDAIASFEGAVAAGPEGPALLNDLAAGLIARAHRDERPADLVRALDLVERALAVEPSDVAAGFNRALVVERLRLAFVAPDLWVEASRSDPATAWSAEAASRAARPEPGPADDGALAAWIAGEGVDALPPAVRSACTRAPARTTLLALAVLLPTWADSALAGDRGAASARLNRLEALGDALAQAGDSTVAASVRAIRGGTPLRRRQLALAHMEYGRGARQRSHGVPTVAEQHFAEAAKTAGGDTAPPIRLWALFGVAEARVTSGDRAGALAMLDALKADPAVAAFPALVAECAWSRGLIAVRGGAFADARVAFDRAAAVAAELGDLERWAGARALAAESVHALGLGEMAWRLRLEAMSILGKQPSLALHNLLLDVALAAEEEGYGHAGLRLREVDLAVATRLRRPTTAVEARLWYGRGLVELGRDDEARAELDSALASAGALPDRNLSARLVADVQEAQGHLLRDSDPEAAVAAYGKALPIYERSDYRWKVPSTLASRARSWLGLGREAEARRDFDAAAAEYERRDRALPPAVYRHSHFERAQGAFDEWLRMEAVAGRMEAALVVAERARRTELLGMVEATTARGGRTPADPAEEVRRAIGTVPPGVAVVEYAVAGNRLLYWVIHGGRLRSGDRPLGDLRQRAEEFARSVSDRRGDSATIESLATGLYRELVAPWIETVPPDTRLVFAPDRFVHRVPFAALRNPQTGLWLAEERVVSSTPGLLFFTSREPATAGGGGAPQALLVADPAFDATETTALAPLAGARAEAEAIASLYARAQTLVGGAANRRAVLDALKSAQVVHYAGHGVANERAPWASYLPLARPADGSSGLLLASEIYGLPRRSWKVVVLSACGSTASMGRLRTGGFQAFVNAFLAAGAEAVVASRWPVDDQRIRPLAVELHRGLARGLDAPEALHRARLQGLRGPGGVSIDVWASFEVTGRAAGLP